MPVNIIALAELVAALLNQLLLLVEKVWPGAKNSTALDAIQMLLEWIKNIHASALAAPVPAA